MRTYSITENILIDKLLKTVPRGIAGSLPFEAFAKTNDWQELLKTRDEKSLKAAMYRRWKDSLIEVKAPTTPPKHELNHAYNYCPSCGFKLN